MIIYYTVSLKYQEKLEEDIAKYTKDFRTESIDQHTLLLLCESIFPNHVKPLWKVQKNLKKVMDFIGEYIVLSVAKEKSYKIKKHQIIGAKIDACKLF